MIYSLYQFIVSLFALYFTNNDLVRSDSDFFRMYEENADKLSVAYIDNFIVKWDNNDPYILITNTLEPDKVLFQTLPSWPFVTVGFATDSKPPIIDGNSRINEWTLYETPYQSIKNVSSINSNEFIIYGEVWGSVTLASYELRLSIAKDLKSNKLLKSQLSFELVVTPIQGTFNRVFLNYWCDTNENFYGFGTQYTYWNMKGKRIPILVAEQGIGRGAQPLTSLLNFVGDGAGGDWSTTYSPKPLYVTNFNRSILIENSEITFFDTRDDDSVVIEVWGTSMRGRILYGDSMLGLITEITEYTGRMKKLPYWTQKGAIVGLEGGTEHVLNNVDKLLQHKNGKATIPLAGVWIQDWVGLRNAYDGDRLKWNWRLDTEYYPDWDGLVRRLSESNTRVLTYINPFFANTDEFEIGSKNRRNLYKEGIANSYFVLSPVNNTQPYKLRSGSIEFCTLDTTNPAAREWMKNIIKDEMIRNTSSSGFMADFGEYLPFDAVLFDKSVKGSEYHNRYPEEWGKIVSEAFEEIRIEKSKLNNEEEVESDLMYFMRSAWLQSPGQSSLSFWLGDQMVSWDKHDGIKSVLVAAMTSGIGGHSLTHSDIGGYTMFEGGPISYTRTKELLIRWIELAAFGSALFRTHVGLSTSPEQAQVYECDIVMEHFAKFSTIFAYLSEYRVSLMKEASEKGWPLMRPMSAHFAYDPRCWELTEQYMFGGELLVAPVLDPVDGNTIRRKSNIARNGKRFLKDRVSVVNVYIPAMTDWIHLWSGQTVHGGDEGTLVSVDAPFGSPPVFYRPGSEIGKKLRDFIITLDMDVITLKIDDLLQFDDCLEIDENNISHIITNCHKPRMSDIDVFVSPSWYDWLGISEYASTFV